MNTAVTQPLDGERPLLLRDFLSLLWRRRLTILATAGAVMFLTALSLYLITPKYRITATVIEKRDETTQSAGLSLSGSLSSISSSILGGRASLGANYQQFLYLLTEPSTLERLPDKETILHTIFENEWDAEKNTWVRHIGPNSALNMIFGLPPKNPPDTRRLSETLKKMVVITPIETGPLYQLSFDWRDPSFGRALLSDLIKSADDTLRVRRAAELRSREAYLSNKLVATTTVEQRQALSQLLGQTVLSQAVLFQTPNYSIDVVQRPTASDAPVSPAPLLDLIFAAVAGAVLAVIGIFSGAITAGIHPADYGRTEEFSWLHRVTRRRGA